MQLGQPCEFWSPGNVNIACFQFLFRHSVLFSQFAFAHMLCPFIFIARENKGSCGQSKCRCPARTVERWNCSGHLWQQFILISHTLSAWYTKLKCLFTRVHREGGESERGGRERGNSYAAPNEFSTCVLWIFFGLPDILRDCHQFSVALPLHFAYR